MVKVSALLLILLAGCGVFDYVKEHAPPGVKAEQVISPAGRYTAQLWRFDTTTHQYISGFDIADSQSGTHYWQNLQAVENLNPIAGGVYFEWTPTENYLIVVTDPRVTSHGCDDLLVYTGDGHELVYSSVSTSICRSIMADIDFGLIALCPNDDILYSLGSRFRLTPSTGTQITLEDPNATC